MQPLYNVPLIPQNLRREETIVQTADALRHLTEVSNDIFNRINKRIEVNTAHLATVAKRIEVAQQKVSKLQGAKKATQVFSSSKYPAISAHRPYTSVFSKDHKILLSRSKFKFKDEQINDEPLETLQFYHVNIEALDNESPLANGLGSVPLDIISINDLLLCNTGKNPYANYVISDPLQALTRLRKEEFTNASSIGAAPHSLVERATLAMSAKDSYFYSPDLGNVPSIDVPLDLPDLPGVADDLRYIDQAGPGIAPSVTSTPVVPDLPPIVPESYIIDSTPDLPVVPSTTSVAIPDLEEIPEEHSRHVSETPKNVEIPVSEIKLNTPTTLPTIDDAHASLMESIRKAAGTTSGIGKSPVAKTVPTGDFMADLHAKLSLRRKGISGLNNPDPNATTNLDSNTTLQKISAMIPPPPVKVEQSDSTNTEDEDWDD